MSAELSRRITYSDELVGWLKELGYTHCFFLGGGNIMHLLDSVRNELVCIPVIHEVAAGIAAEYFNVISRGGKAFALVTAGPGLTNIVTAVGAAWLESRELLVIGGQAKTGNLAHGRVRQVGHQEIDGVGIVGAITKEAVRVDRRYSADELAQLVGQSWSGRPGPVFLEMCLDVTAAPAAAEQTSAAVTVPELPVVSDQLVDEIADQLRAAARPLLLVGGGVRFDVARALWPKLEELGLPCAATWNGADRVPDDLSISFGRPNTYGRRSSNLLIQQADVVLALGTRLGLQQTGFAADKFAAGAQLIQVDIDPNELDKETLTVDRGICADANDLMTRLVDQLFASRSADWSGWLDYGRKVQSLLPVAEPVNTGSQVDPLVFIEELSGRCVADDIIVPCSSGNTFLGTMQCFQLKQGQRMITDKGSASMGYGLSGAIGAALAAPDRRVVHLEGDGGFAQNMQELGTVIAQNLNIKMFLFANHGYASIRLMQRNYFDGAYLGCDERTGVHLPDWRRLFESFGVRAIEVGTDGAWTDEMAEAFTMEGPVAYLVPVDPDQTNWPKITSSLNADGTMSSNPLHRMTPPLVPEIAEQVMVYIDEDARR